MSARIAPPPGPVRYNTAADRAVRAFEDAVSRLRGVDPVTTELVRMRCARIHDCRKCQAVRYGEALDAGVDDDLLARVIDVDHPDLAPSHRAALRLADAMILTPGAVDPGLRNELRAHFTPPQIAEMCLDIVKFSVQKTLVALRIDEPVGAGVDVLRTQPDGSMLVTPR